ncbi:hypothetical protein DY000_02025014 [Brassica cretica]|uniref:Uncharacterized protein n=1 Tax=Brassica cretica TaxID=69181 RepID=A0ABQ7EE47_BRACR|nr:hypothetical protein DY000_02025014 [Brassica cretica]
MQGKFKTSLTGLGLAGRLAVAVGVWSLCGVMEIWCVDHLPNHESAEDHMIVVFYGFRVVFFSLSFLRVSLLRGSSLISLDYGDGLLSRSWLSVPYCLLSVDTQEVLSFLRFGSVTKLVVGASSSRSFGGCGIAHIVFMLGSLCAQLLFFRGRVGKAV